jgi:DNA-binding winged helix-turn-helix (wHTH) protein/Flp pilus assembly protein TadD
MNVYEFGPFRLDEEQLLLCLGEEPMALGPKVVETLLALVRHPNEVLSKSELLDKVWPEGFVEEANLAQNVYVIRKTLRAYWNVEAIATVPRRGYRFVAPVSIAAAPEAQTESTGPAPVADVPAPPAPPQPYVRRFGWGIAAIAATFALFAGTFALVERPHPAVAAHAVPALSANGARLYTVGHFYWNQRTRDGVEKSIRYFEAVTKSDPNAARGFAALAQAYAIEGDYKYGKLTSNESYARALRYARHALALDPRSAEAHAAMGIAQDRPKMRALAQAEYRKAIALDPAYAPPHQWYGISLLMQGKSEAAYAELKRAAELEPLSVATNDWLATASYFSRHYGAAVEYARQTLDLAPQRTNSYQILGLSYEAMGRYPEALDAYKAYAATCERCRLEVAPLMAHTYAAASRYDDARAQLQIAQTAMARNIADPEDVVMALVALGKRDDALRILQRESRKSMDATLAMDPRMDPVRKDARFRQWTQGPA